MASPGERKELKNFGKAIGRIEDLLQDSEHFEIHIETESYRASIVSKDSEKSKPKNKSIRSSPISVGVVGSFIAMMVLEISTNLISNILWDIPSIWVQAILIITGIIGGFWVHTCQTKENLIA